jgi:hypothetical protein
MSNRSLRRPSDRANASDRASRGCAELLEGVDESSREPRRVVGGLDVHVRSETSPLCGPLTHEDGLAIPGWRADDRQRARDLLIQPLE